MQEPLSEEHKALAQRLWEEYSQRKQTNKKLLREAEDRAISNMESALADMAWGGLAGHAAKHKAVAVARLVNMQKLSDAETLVKNLRDLAPRKDYNSVAVSMGLSFFLEQIGIENPFKPPTLNVAEQVGFVFDVNTQLIRDCGTLDVAVLPRVTSLQNNLLEHFKENGDVRGWKELIEKALECERNGDNHHYVINAFNRLLEFTNDQLNKKYSRYQGTQLSKGLEGSWREYWQAELNERGKKFPSH